MDRRLGVPLFGAALFLSAALLFNVQPMVGKLLLPRVGGSPEVWNVSVAFFQTMLLAGYLLAHTLGRMSPRLHGVAYLLVLASAAAFLPLGLPDGWRPDGPPQLAILAVLLRSVGLPFLALSLGAPTLQRLFAASAHEDARDPYFLYAASNAGSFAGLLLYPFVFEPLLAVFDQARLWAGVYATFGALAVATVVFSWRGADTPITRGGVRPTPIPWSERLRWVALAAVPSSLTLGVTTHIATDIATTPLLWAVTLGLYLLTFIVAFARRGRRLRGWALDLHPWLGAIAVATAVVSVLGTWVGVGVQLLGFTASALACHVSLAARRPPPEQLTSYYLYLSVGGALGGSFNAFVAPTLFDRPLEYPLFLVFALALNPLRADGAAKAAGVGGLLLAAVGFGAIATGYGGAPALGWAIVGAVFAGLVLAARRPAAVIPIGAVLSGGVIALVHSGDHFADRNFFGIVRVKDVTLEDGRRVRQILHGTTVHGGQIVGPAVEAVPISYYSQYSPIAVVFDTFQPDRVGVIGLASGGMNCYARPGQTFRFYEIDPLMVHVANTAFTFLHDCPPPVVSVGDGRLLIEAEPEHSFDLIAIDAFASDSIPVHLLTTDAIAVYLSRLDDDGVLAFHISSRYFELEPIVAANGEALGLAVAVSAVVPPEHDRAVASTSKWAVLARTPDRLQRLSTARGWRRVSAPSVRPWTDGYSNPLSALKRKPGYPEATPW